MINNLSNKKDASQIRNAGDIVLKNASIMAIREAQDAYEGVADEIGVKDEEDVQKLVDEVRHERK